MSQQLIHVLQGCLDSSSVLISTERLKQLSEGPTFLSQLLQLVPNQQNNLLVMVLSTLKNYLLARYNSKQLPVPHQQKHILKGSLLDLFYEIKQNSQAVNLYKQIIYIVIAVDYPWLGIEQALDKDLNGPIMATVYFSRQVLKVNQWFQGDQRRLLEDFTAKYFPRLELILQQILSNYNDETAKLLDQILKSFYSAFHIEVSVYLRNFQRLDQWLLFFQTILNAPPGTLALSSQQIVSQIYVKLFSHFCNDVQDGKNYKGWAQAFRQKYAERIFSTTTAIVISGKGNEDTINNLINCLHQVVKQDSLRILFTQKHCQALIYGNLLPLCQITQDEIALFSNDEIEYVRRQDDLSCFPVRRAVLDLIEMVASKLFYNGKSQMIRIVEYSATVLSSATALDSEKEVVVRVLTKIGKQLLKNKYLKAQFQNLTVQYFLPLLRSQNLFLNVAVCELLSLYLPFGDLSNQTVTQLMQLIYDKIVNGSSLVTRYNAILAFTALLNHKAALQAAHPHFQSILQIYVQILNTFDHQNLLGCLQSIVKYFSGQIERYAPDLVAHLLRMFCSHCEKAKTDEEGQDQPDGNSPATAALSTIKQILTCNLKDQVYFNISKDLIQILRGIFGQYDHFFDEILSLFNVLVHKAVNIADFEYPYLACRKLLQGDNSLLVNSSLPTDILQQLSKAQKADSEFEQSLISILKNLIQKMPEFVLKRYPYPFHQQLLLCLIENKRILPQQLGNLNTSLVDSVWSPYLTSYSWSIYGVGSLFNSNNLKAIVGVSLYPWLNQGLTPQVIKLIVNSIEDEEDDDDDLLEENTAQLLQRYANEDDEQQNQEDSFYASSGTNYSYLYDSPFDSSKDGQFLVSRLKILSQSDALALMNALTPKYRKKVQSFFNNS